MVYKPYMSSCKCSHAGPFQFKIFCKLGLTKTMNLILNYSKMAMGWNVRHPAAPLSTKFLRLSEI